MKDDVVSNLRRNIQMNLCLKGRESDSVISMQSLDSDQTGGHRFGDISGGQR